MPPLELGPLLELSPVYDGRLVITAGFGHGVAASQTSRPHRRSRYEGAPGTLGKDLLRQTGNEREFGAQGMALLARRDRRQERELVLRTAPRLAVRAFAAQGRVIDRPLAAEPMARFSLFHRPHQLVGDQPGGGIAHPQVPLQCQRRQTRPGRSPGTPRSAAACCPETPCRQSVTFDADRRCIETPCPSPRAKHHALSSHRTGSKSRVANGPPPALPRTAARCQSAGRTRASISRPEMGCGSWP